MVGDREMKGKSHTNKIKAYIPDWFVLVVTENSTCTQTCKCTELERFPLKLDFTSHKNLGCDVLLSLFSHGTHINTHYIIHFRQKKKKKREKSQAIIPLRKVHIYSLSLTRMVNPLPTRKCMRGAIIDACLLSEGPLRSWSPGLNLKQSLVVNDNTSAIDSEIP